MTMSEVRGEVGVQTFGPMVFSITSFVFGLTATLLGMAAVALYQVMLVLLQNL